MSTREVVVIKATANGAFTKENGDAIASISGVLVGARITGAATVATFSVTDSRGFVIITKSAVNPSTGVNYGGDDTAYGNPVTGIPTAAFSAVTGVGHTLYLYVAV
jgi:hypothetical protein